MGTATTGHDDPVSPVDANMVRPSATAWRSAACQSSCLVLFTATTPPGRVGPVPGAPPVAGDCSHSPNDELPWSAPLGSLFQWLYAASRSSSVPVLPFPSS